MPVDVVSSQRAPRVGAPGAPDSGALWGAVFTTLNDTFWSLCRGPAPLALPGALLAAGRARPARLVEVQRLLLARRRGLDPAGVDRVLAEVVRRAQTGAPEWIVGASGVLLPGLAAKVNRLTAGYEGDRDDLEAEVLAGFLTALATIDPDAGRLAGRLTWAGFRAGRALRRKEEQDLTRRAVGGEAAPPRQPWGHPDLVLAEAVRQQVISFEDAELIGTTRLGGVSIDQAAVEWGRTRDATIKRRWRAERRLVEAIGRGDLSSPGPVRAAGRDDAGPKDSQDSFRRRVLEGPEIAVAECRSSTPGPVPPAPRLADRVGSGVGAA